MYFQSHFNMGKLFNIRISHCSVSACLCRSLSSLISMNHLFVLKLYLQHGIHSLLSTVSTWNACHLAYKKSFTKYVHVSSKTKTNRKMKTGHEHIHNSNSTAKEKKRSAKQTFRERKKKKKLRRTRQEPKTMLKEAKQMHKRSKTKCPNST